MTTSVTEGSQKFFPKTIGGGGGGGEGKLLIPVERRIVENRVMQKSEILGAGNK